MGSVGYYIGSTIRVIVGDTRRIDYGAPMALGTALNVFRKGKVFGG